MEIAFGVQASEGVKVLRPFAEERGAATLLGGDFVDRLSEALHNPENTYAWTLTGFRDDWARNSIGFFEARYVDQCGYTNWEFLTFWTRPDLWPRTRWWKDDLEIANPLEGWPP